MQIERHNIRRKRRNVVISSLVPIILLFIMGSVIGKKWANENVENQETSSNESSDSKSLNKTAEQDVIYERHRHRYEYNNDYREQMEKNGLKIVGTSPDGNLVEIVELENHTFFVGCQFHPEFKSRPDRPHPLFVELVAKSIK